MVLSNACKPALPSTSNVVCKRTYVHIFLHIFPYESQMTMSMQTQAIIVVQVLELLYRGINSLFLSISLLSSEALEVLDKALMGTVPSTLYIPSLWFHTYVIVHTSYEHRLSRMKARIICAQCLALNVPLQWRTRWRIYSGTCRSLHWQNLLVELHQGLKKNYVIKYGASCTLGMFDFPRKIDSWIDSKSDHENWFS